MDFVGDLGVARRGAQSGTYSSRRRSLVLVAIPMHAAGRLMKKIDPMIGRYDKEHVWSAAPEPAPDLEASSPNRVQ